MKILFLGGSGVISRAVAQLTIADGHELWLLNRGERRPVEGARHLRADAADADGIRSALAGHRWDVVVDWIAYARSDIRRDLEFFRTSVRQYIFISSTSVYQKPLEHYLVTEETPLSNPYWEYSRLKIACETELRAACEKGFPGVIVRPSHTYGEGLCAAGPQSLEAELDDHRPSPPQGSRSSSRATREIPSGP